MTTIAVPGPFAAARRRKSGAAGRRWIAALPDLVARLCRRWSVELHQEEPPRYGDLALVLCGRYRGEPCVLKVSWPEHSTAHEAAALRAWNGRGAVRLLAASPADGALLLERLTPDRSLEDLDLLTAAGIAGALVRELAVPAPPGLPLLTEQARRIADGLGPSQARLGQPLPQAWVEQGGARSPGPALTRTPR
jgi:streptomycin 6-kinase